MLAGQKTVFSLSLANILLLKHEKTFMIKVFKFGGASVCDAASVKKVGNILEHFGNNKLLVVISAMGKTTNALEALLSASQTDSAEAQKLFDQIKAFHLKIIDELFPKPDPFLMNRVEDCFTILSEELSRLPERESDQSYDQVVSIGELLSTIIISHWLKASGADCLWIDSREYVLTDSRHRAAKVDWQATERRIKPIEQLFGNHRIILTQGFIGRSASGLSSTLGREGSDFSAAIFAYCLNATEVTIWKDVPGLLNGDPKRMQQTVQLFSISYNEAIELAFYGATVIHPKTIKPLQNKNIPLFVRSFIRPELKPSLISENNADDALESSYIFKDNQLLISISPRDFSFMDEGCLETIFGLLAKRHIHTSLMQTSALSLSLCIDYHNGLIDTLKGLFSDRFFVRYNHGLTLLTVRHYTEDKLPEILAGKKILLEQRSRTTLQFVLGEAK